MTQPQIVVGYGAVNPGFAAPELERFEHKHMHQDLSCVWITPSRGCIPARVVDSWLSLLKAPNQRFAQLFAVGMEVGAAYDALVGMILANPELSKWRYILTVEEDNLPQPKAFVDLLEAAEEGEFDVLGGLYYVKGPANFAQAWGDPNDEAENYRPQLPRLADGEDPIVRCVGTGMGFTLYRMDLFRRMPPPWFRTDPREDGPWTQDLVYFHRLWAAGIKPKVGVHCGIRVGHLDVDSGVVW